MGRLDLSRALVPVAWTLAACPSEPVPEDTDGPPASTGDTDSDSDGASASGPGTSTDATPTSTGGAASTASLSDTDTSTTTSTTSTSTTTTSTTTGDLGTCGDGVLDPGELCDDGNLLAGDECLPDCTPGTGAVLPPIELPPLPDTLPGISWRRCLTVLDADVIGAPEHALVVGSSVPDLEGLYSPWIERFPLPAAEPLAWAFTPGPAMFDRWIVRVASAADGDVVAAGFISIEPVDPLEPSTAFLWIARLSPAGDVVWSHDLESIAGQPRDLEWTPSGDIVVVGFDAVEGSWLHVFDPDGAPLWQHAAPFTPEWEVRYGGATVDDAGDIYVVGEGSPEGGNFSHLTLESFTGDGAPLWQVDVPSPTFPRVTPTDVVFTEKGSLIVAVTQGISFGTGTPGLAAFDTDSAALWWEQLPKPRGWSVFDGRIVAAPGGGVIVPWGEGQEDTNRTRVARYAEDGATLWSLPPVKPAPRDATMGPDGLFYVLQGDHVYPHVP